MGDSAMVGIDQQPGSASKDVLAASLGGSTDKTGIDGALKNGRTIGRPSPWQIDQMDPEVRLQRVDFGFIEDPIPHHRTARRVANLRLPATIDAIGRVRDRTQTRQRN